MRSTGARGASQEGQGARGHPVWGTELTPSRAAGGAWLLLAAGLCQGGSFGIRVTAQETRPPAPLKQGTCQSPRWTDVQAERWGERPPTPSKAGQQAMGRLPTEGGRERVEQSGPPGSWSLVAASDLRLGCSPPSCVFQGLPGQQLPNPLGGKEDPSTSRGAAAQTAAEYQMQRQDLEETSSSAGGPPGTPEDRACDQHRVCGGESSFPWQLCDPGGAPDLSVSQFPSRTIGC